VLLMDEPLSNLDALLRMHTREELLRLHREVPGTIVYVTHDQVEAMTMGDRIGIMQRGRLVQVGSPLDVYDRPVNRFVAGFIGTPPMSFVQGRLAAAHGVVRFEGDGVALELPGELARAAEAAADGRDGWALGIRPEAVQVSESNGGPPSGWSVEVVEHLGAESILGLRCGTSFIRSRLSFGARFERSCPVDLGFPDAALHLFTPSGRHVLA
jgi:ABC-type sugar transport system ATPase subunit